MTNQKGGEPGFWCRSLGSWAPSSRRPCWSFTSKVWSRARSSAGSTSQLPGSGSSTWRWWPSPCSSCPPYSSSPVTLSSSEPSGSSRQPWRHPCRRPIETTTTRPVIFSKRISIDFLEKKNPKKTVSAVDRQLTGQLKWPCHKSPSRCGCCGIYI